MKRILAVALSILLALSLCACRPQTQQTPLLEPEYILENALNKSLEEVETALEVTLSQENRNTATGGYVVPCHVAFEGKNADHVELQFAQEKLAAAMYTFSDIESAKVGWGLLKKLGKTMTKEGYESAMGDLHGQASSFESHETYDDFYADAEKLWESNPLPAEAMDLYYVGDHAQCELAVAVTQEGAFSVTITYSEIRWDSY